MSTQTFKVGLAIQDSSERARFGFLSSEIDRLFLELCQSLAIAGFTVVNLGNVFPDGDRLHTMRHVRAAYCGSGPTPFRHLISSIAIRSMQAEAIRAWLGRSEDVVRTFVMTDHGPVALRLSGDGEDDGTDAPRSIISDPMALAPASAWKSPRQPRRTGSAAQDPLLDALVIAGGDRSLTAMDEFVPQSARFWPFLQQVDAGLQIIPIPTYGGLAGDIVEAAGTWSAPPPEFRDRPSRYDEVIRFLGDAVRNGNAGPTGSSVDFAFEDRPDAIAEFVTRRLMHLRRELEADIVPARTFDP